MSFIPRPHEIYKHFKGNLYQIVAIAEHSETGEALVVYQALYGDFKIYARPLDMFVGKVDKQKYPDVTQEYRFELQGAQRERRQAESYEEKSAKPNCVIPQACEATCEYAEESAVSENQQTTGLSEQESEELNLDPLVLEFLDADSYEERLNILAGLHHRITNEMITTMAIACDVEVAEGDIEERFESLKQCLLTLEKYECNRLR